MSDPLRVGFVMEGPTDYVVLLAAVRALLNGRDFVPTRIQPELTDQLSAQSAGGWGGVYRWCREVVDQAGGPAHTNPVFLLHDVVVIQVDADIARRRYSDYRITDAPRDDLPCDQPCPPADVTTNALREVMLGWLSETSVPTGAVFCTPSKNIETWVLMALFPEDFSHPNKDVECRWDGKVRLRKWGMIKSGQKLKSKYQESENRIQFAWSKVRKTCNEAERFSTDFTKVLKARMTS